jgi:hypothetical protein
MRSLARHLGLRERLGELRLALRVDGEQLRVVVILFVRGLCGRERRLGVVYDRGLQVRRRTVLGARDLGACRSERTRRGRLMRAPPGRDDEERKGNGSADSVAHATSASQTTCQSRSG